jgi:hypothetical protein
MAALEVDMQLAALIILGFVALLIWPSLEPILLRMLRHRRRPRR